MYSELIDIMISIQYAIWSWKRVPIYINLYKNMNIYLRHRLYIINEMIITWKVFSWLWSRATDSIWMNRDNVVLFIYIFFLFICHGARKLLLTFPCRLYGIKLFFSIIFALSLYLYTDKLFWDMIINID